MRQTERLFLRRALRRAHVDPHESILLDHRKTLNAHPRSGKSLGSLGGHHDQLPIPAVCPSMVWAADASVEHVAFAQGGVSVEATIEQGRDATVGFAKEHERLFE